MDSGWVARFTSNLPITPKNGPSGHVTRAMRSIIRKGVPTRAPSPQQKR